MIYIFSLIALLCVSAHNCATAQNAKEINEKPAPVKVADNQPIKKQTSPTPVKIVSQEASPQERSITVKNLITKDMKTYKGHWSGPHTPAKLLISINGLPLEDKNVKNKKTKKLDHIATEQSIKVVNNKIDVEIFYEFRAMGMCYRKGTRTYTCTLPENITCLETAFSWQDDNRILLTPPGKKEHLKLVAID